MGVQCLNCLNDLGGVVYVEQYDYQKKVIIDMGLNVDVKKLIFIVALLF